MGTRSLVWSDGSSSGTTSFGGVPITITAVGGVFIATRTIPLLGKLWSENTMAAELTNGVEISNILEKEYTLIRVRGYAAFRALGLSGATPGQSGAYGLWLVRSGFIVLPSNGDLTVPTVDLFGNDSNNVEAQWLYTEQFVLSSTGRDSAFTFGEFAVDGNNHAFITRTYDITVGRRLEKDDLLCWVISMTPFDDAHGQLPEANPTVYGMVHSFIRCLSRRIG